MNTYTPVTPAEYRQFRGHTRPGVVAAHDAIIFMMGGSVRSGGMVNDRNVRGGTAKSLHAVGRAADFMVQKGTGTRDGMSPRQVGDELFVRLIAAAPGIGLDEVIWNRHRWTNEKGVRPYSGANPHTDHVHAGFDPSFADSTKPHDDLCRWVAACVFPPRAA